MTERITDSRFITWLRELFLDATAESMFRWVIVAWLVLVVAMVVLDRLGAGLLGRSRPIVQTPPERARAWRWGRSTPPPTYSLLPNGTLDPRTAPVPVVAESIPLSTRPIAALGVGVPVIEPNGDHWRSIADAAAPPYGFENNARLEQGDAPERYNPVIGRLEVLERDEATGQVHWPGDSPAVQLGSVDATVQLTRPDQPDEAPESDAEAPADSEAVADTDDETDDADLEHDTVTLAILQDLDRYDAANQESDDADVDERLEIEAGAE